MLRHSLKEVWGASPNLYSFILNFFANNETYNLPSVLSLRFYLQKES